MIKPGIRILGVDDAPFEFNQKNSFIVGVVFRGGSFMEGLLMKKIAVDGEDVTLKIEEMSKGKFSNQIKVIMTNGITFAGFNVLNMQELYEKTGKGVIAVTRKKPNKEKMLKALKYSKNYEKKKNLILAAGEVKEFRSAKGTIYFQNFGISDEDSRKVFKISCTKSLIPEPIRVAHIISSGMVYGESRRRV